MEKVQIYARGYSVDMKRKVRVYTGVYGSLERATKRAKKSVKVYLNMASHPHSTEVPEIIWKALFDEEHKEGAAMFMSNRHDMRPKDIKRFQTICPSKCDQLKIGFEAKQYDHVVCCNIADFKKHITYLPEHEMGANPALLINTVDPDKRSKPIPSTVGISSTRASAADGEGKSKGRGKKKQVSADSHSTPKSHTDSTDSTEGVTDANDKATSMAHATTSSISSTNDDGADSNAPNPPPLPDETAPKLDDNPQTEAEAEAEAKTETESVPKTEDANNSPAASESQEENTAAEPVPDQGDDAEKSEETSDGPIWHPMTWVNKIKNFF